MYAEVMKNVPTKKSIRTNIDSSFSQFRQVGWADNIQIRFK